MWRLVGGCFVHPVAAAVDLGILEMAERDEERFARAGNGGEALYRVDRERLGAAAHVAAPGLTGGRCRGSGAGVIPRH